MSLFRNTIYSLAAVLAAFGTAGSQTTKAAACDLAESAKGDAARAYLLVNLARTAAPSPGVPSGIKSAIKLLENDKTVDPAVNAYITGLAISVAAEDSLLGLSPKRSQLGFAINPDANLDIPRTLDSLFRIAQAARPSCAETISGLRIGQKYLVSVNRAMAYLDKDKLDSAEYYANAANMLTQTYSYGPMLLGAVAMKRKDTDKAIAYWTSAAEIAGRDTTYRDVQRKMLYNIGDAYLKSSATLTGPAQADAQRKAAKTFAALLALPGTNGAMARYALQNVQASYLAAGDTAAAVAAWQPLITNPAAYDYQQLLNTGVNAARVNRPEDAEKLFKSALDKNANSRDALHGTLVMYLQTKQYDKVGALAKRLVDIDPANSDNYFIAATAYQNLLDGAQKAKNTALATAYNDSAHTWYDRGNKIPDDVTVTEFSIDDKQTVIGGSIRDRRDKIVEADVKPAPAKGAKGKTAAAKPAARVYPPQKITLNVSGLDISGAVVDTQSFTSDALTPGQSAKFSITLKGANIVGYKYTYTLTE